MKTNLTNAVSSPSVGMSRMLLGDRPTSTLGAVGGDTKEHMVQPYDLREWTNPHGAEFTDWQASCGAKGRESGHWSDGTCSALASLDLGHHMMLCPICCAGMPR